MQPLRCNYKDMARDSSSTKLSSNCAWRCTMSVAAVQRIKPQGGPVAAKMRQSSSEKRQLQIALNAFKSTIIARAFPSFPSFLSLSEILSKVFSRKYKCIFCLVIELIGRIGTVGSFSQVWEAVQVGRKMARRKLLKSPDICTVDIDWSDSLMEVVKNIYRGGIEGGPPI